jgi:ribosome-binding protein aMBF1 (putative translation factor)
MFIDSINSGKSIPSKSEISNMEKQMKFVFIGKFEMEKNSLMMPLNYKIVKSK